MTVKGTIRKYLGSIETQELAARFYDKYSIIMWGLEVRKHQQNALNLLIL